MYTKIYKPRTEKKVKNAENNGKRWHIAWSTCIKIAVSIFVLYLCIYYWGMISGFISGAISAATPVFAGFAIAYVLNILMSFYERHYFRKLSHVKFVKVTKRPVCLTLSMLTLLGIIALIIGLVVPELVECVTFIVTRIPPLIQDILNSKFVKSILPKDIVATLAGIDWLGYISKIIETVSRGVGDAVNVLVTALTSVISAIITTFVSIIVSVYFLASKDNLARQGKKLLANYVPKKTTDKVMYVLSVINDSFHGYIVGQCMEAVVIGVLCSIGMLIFRFPYAAMIGTLVGFTALIPVAGAFIGAAIGAVMMLTVSPIKALLFLVFILVLQQLEGNIIFPRVVGSSIGLPAVWVLAAVTIGGGLFGVLGMLLGVPLVASAYRLIREDIHRRELKRCEPACTGDEKDHTQSTNG